LGSTSDLDACPGKRILDGDELLPDLCKFVVKVLFGITPEPDNLFFCLFADLEGFFAELEGFFAELEGFFADLEGFFADLEGLVLC